MENVNIQECPVLVASVFLTQLVIQVLSFSKGGRFGGLASRL